MKRVYVLWDGERAVGICVFCTPAYSLRLRNRYFGLSGKRTRLAGRSLNQQLLTLSRVVLDPKYRGAGLVSGFIRRCCELSGAAWVEALAEMGRVNPFFERAGFVRVGTCVRRGTSRRSHSEIYGGGRLLSEGAHRKSEYAEPVYYVLDNRSKDCGRVKLGGGDVSEEGGGQVTE